MAFIQPAARKHRPDAFVTARVTMLPMTRDPRSDPQPGDEMRGGCYIRKVVRREGDKVLIEGFNGRYWMRVDRWQEWCEKSGAEAAPVVKQEG